MIGISVDSPFSQEAWAKQEKISVPLLSDLDREVCQKYGTISPNIAGYKSASSRAAFVLDKSGIVRYVEVLADAKQLPNFDAIKQTLAASK